MKKNYRNSTLALTALFAGSSVFSGMAFAGPTGTGSSAGSSKLNAKLNDFLACYKVVEAPDVRLKLNVLKHSALSELLEERNFGHSRQFAFSVHGKTVGACGGDLVSATYGTALVAEPSPFLGKSGSTVATPVASQVGAHLGVTIASIKGGCGPITLDCSSSEISPIPSTWSCFFQLESPEITGNVTLVQVDETVDPRCSLFVEDFAAPAPATATGGFASLAPTVPPAK